MKYPTVRWAKSIPDFPVVMEGKHVITHAGLEHRIVEAAGRLHAIGATPGDRVALLARNSREWIVIAHAVTRVEAVLVPLSTRLATAEILELLEIYTPRVILADAQSEFTLTCGSPWSDRIARLGEQSDHAERWWSRIPPAAIEVGMDVDPERPCTIISTSGTTGKPKGVCLSLANHLAAAEASGLNLRSGPNDRWLVNLPLHHIGGLAIIYRAAVSGLAMVVHGRFDVQQMVEAVEQAGVTHLSLVENTLLRLLEAWGDRRFPATLRGVLIGGGPVDSGLLLRARSLGLPVLPTYGLTEAASQVATQSPDVPVEVMTTVGRPLANCEVEIQDASGKPLPAGVEGTIAIRGPMVAQGYWKSDNPIAPSIFNGWFTTGDIGVIDDCGYLTIRGRSDDMIVSGGEKVFPAEIEACLVRVPGIRHVAVIGVNDLHWGMVPVAFVELQPGNIVTEAKITDSLAGVLAHFKIPKRFIPVERLPRTGAGKIDRLRLAAIYRERTNDVPEN